MHVKREIAEYIGKEYTNGGDVRWTLKQEKLNIIDLTWILETSVEDVDRDIFKVDIS